MLFDLPKQFTWIQNSEVCCITLSEAVFAVVFSVSENRIMQQTCHDNNVIGESHIQHSNYTFRTLHF